MKRRLVAFGIWGLATTMAAAACSGDDDAGSPSAPAAGAAGNGAGNGGKASGGGSSTAGNSSAGTTSTGGTGAGGTGTGGTGTGGTGTGGTGTGGVSTGGTSTGGVPIFGGESGMGGALDGGAGGVAGAAGDGGAGGAGGAVDQGVTLTPTTCNYTEVESNSSQDSGLSAPTTPKVICGKVDTGHFNAGDGLVDKDTYGISLAGHDGLIRLELPTFTGLTRIEATIDQYTIVITQPVTVFNMFSVFSGAVFLRISAYGAGELSEAIPYQLSFVSDNVAARCPANTNTATFTEAGDGANSRGNDVYTFDNGVPSFTTATDSAEATGITLAQTSYRVNGTSADVSRAGDFLDGDGYRFHTGPTTTQLTLRADWQGSHDLDLFVLKDGTAQRAGYANKFSNTSPEYVTVLVKPNTDYIAFAGGASGSPFGYSLTLCGETYSFNGP